MKYIMPFFPLFFFFSFFLQKSSRFCFELGTHHHLIYRVDDIIHFLPRDKTVVVNVVQSKGPCKTNTEIEMNILNKNMSVANACERDYHFHRKSFDHFIVSINNVYNVRAEWHYTYIYIYNKYNKNL